MENQIVSTPISDDRPPQEKADDFDPPVTSGGPIVDDKPGPPTSYDVDGSDAAKK